MLFLRCLIQLSETDGRSKKQTIMSDLTKCTMGRNPNRVSPNQTHYSVLTFTSPNPAALAYFLVHLWYFVTRSKNTVDVIRRTIRHYDFGQ